VAGARGRIPVLDEAEDLAEACDAPYPRAVTRLVRAALRGPDDPLAVEALAEAVSIAPGNEPELRAACLLALARRTPDPLAAAVAMAEVEGLVAGRPTLESVHLLVLQGDEDGARARARALGVPDSMPTLTGWIG
jgi:hypothetical protein